ncbi:MAG: AAA family ATPase [Chrysiogenales bacterium]
MLTSVRIRNFKKFNDANIPLGNSVVFIGPNNSGKTTALQALALWDIGIQAWKAKRTGKSSPEMRPGVAINRKDLITIPIPIASLIWHDLHVRKGKHNGGGTQNIRIGIEVSGITNSKSWTCGLEFDFRNEESFVCRPIRLNEYEDAPVDKAKFSEIPKEANGINIVYLPPMSGLSAQEPLLQKGRINVLMGQGETAQVLRNLCYQIFDQENGKNSWELIKNKITSLFGVELQPPNYNEIRGEITMEYIEHGVRLDLSCSGRGLQQTLLLLAYLYVNPESVLMLDEPDAHLEILRQREIFKIITETAEANGSQVIIASHSEVVLGEAAAKGMVVAFVGSPHLLNNRGSQLQKALSDIGWEHYYQAEQKGWILYLEGPSDLEILRIFARTLEHEKAIAVLSRPYFFPVATNLPHKCREHFFGLLEAKPDLVGIAIFDRLDKELKTDTPLKELMWKKREIENYFCIKDVFLKYALGKFDRSNLFEAKDAEQHKETMITAIEEVVNALNVLDKPDSKPWSSDIKASDDFMDPIFKKYFAKLNLPIIMQKTNYYSLAAYLSKDQIEIEVREKLDEIVAVADKARAFGE